MSDKTKKNKKNISSILINAANLLRAAKYSTKTESAFNEYAIAESDIRKIIVTFRDFKENTKQDETDKVEPPIAAI